MPTRTFLFVDQVRSTEQLTRLGDAVAHEVRRALFDLLRQATEVAGGHEVDFTGDGLFCAFEGAAEGVDAAVAMQQLVWSFNGRQPADRRLAIRIGLNTGEPLESEGGGYFGTAVVVAARLCASADEGQILASEVVRTLVEPRGVHGFDAVGALDLKGVPEPVATFAVGWTPDDRREAIPAGLAAAAAHPLVGRAVELAAVERAWHEVQDGGRRLVLVSGDRGIGVTRLLAEAATRARAGGAAIWFGQGDGVGQRLGPWAQAFGGWASTMPRAELRLALGDRETELARIVPQLTGWVPRLGSPAPVDPAAATFLVADALDEVVVRWGIQEPLVVVLDRLEEADPDTLSVARRLAESPRGGRLLLLAGYEPSAVGTPRVLSALQGVSGLVDLRLQGLAEPEIAALIAHVSGEPPGEQQLRAIARESEGSPYFVVQMASALKERSITARVEEAIQRADNLRTDLRLQREEIGLGLRQLEQLRSPQVDPATTVVEPDGTPPAPVACPYKGLVSFQPADAGDFHGRELLVAELIARLVSSRFLAVIGASGSGKSSAVRAGLLPALARGAVPGSQTWLPVVMTPGTDPAASLTAALATVHPGEPSVLIVDQFEELWTTSEPASRAAFLDLLADAADDASGSLVTVVTVRADYYGRLAEHPRLAALVADSQVLVGPMRPSELRAAIERPAAVAGLTLEPGLAQTIIDDAAEEPGALPLVSTALLETWERRRGRSLTVSGYAEAGGVRGAIAHLAEAAYAELDPEQQEAAQRVLSRLAAPGDGGDDVARPLPLAELADDPTGLAVLDRLATRRLVTVSSSSAQVAHEALLREWPRLRSWLDTDRDGRRLHQQIASAATEWDTGDRDPGALLRGVRLAAASDFQVTQPTRLSAVERDFIAASEQARTSELTRARRTTRRFQQLAFGLVVLLVGAVVASGLAIVQRRTATERATQADARGLAAQAIALSSTSADLALLLGVEGYRRDASIDTEGGLLAALNGARYLTAYRPALAGTVDTAVAGDGQTAWTVDGEGAIRGLDTTTWRPVGAPVTAQGAPNYLGVSGDGARLVYDGPNGSHVVDTASGRHLGGAIGSESIMPSSISSDGTTVLVHDRSTRQALVVDAATGRRRAAITIGAGITTVGALRPGHDEVVVATWASQPLIRRYRLDGTPLAAQVELTLPLIDTVAASPDGSHYVVTADNQVLLLAADTLAPLSAPVSLRGGRATEVAFSPNGTTVAVGADDGSITVINREDASVVTTISGLRGSAWPEFLDGNRLLGVTSSQAAEYDLRHPVAVGSAISPSPVLADLVPTPSGDAVLAVEEDGLSLVTADLQRTAVPTTVPAGWFRDAVAVSPDGAVAAVHRFFLDADHLAAQAAVDLIDLPSGRLRATVALNGRKEEDRYNARMEFSPDGGRLAVGLISGGLAVLDARRPGILLPPTDVDTLDRALYGLWWRPDGATLYAGGQDGVLRELDPATGTRRRQLKLAAGAGVDDLDPVPGTSLLAVSAESGQVFLVDTASFTVAGQPFSAGATQLQAVAVTADGSRVAAASRDGAIRIWDRATGRPIGPALQAHGGEARSLEFLRDGRLVTGGADGTLISWRLDPASMVERACALAGRNLTRQEWTRYLPDRPYRATCPAHPSGATA
jgi:class 3 adenylate cyclase/WD40 repeat protein